MMDEFDKWLKHDSEFASVWPDFSSDAIRLARAAFSAQSGRSERPFGELSRDDDESKGGGA